MLGSISRNFKFHASHIVKSEPIGEDEGYLHGHTFEVTMSVQAEGVDRFKKYFSIFETAIINEVNYSFIVGEIEQYGQVLDAFPQTKVYILNLPSTHENIANALAYNFLHMVNDSLFNDGIKGLMELTLNDGETTHISQIYQFGTELVGGEEE